ncbi:protachykinin-1-like [Hyperolius riggenbachi]|uniref:protachykinin-1-like n=1 Tax=Hyperolius riggenbachi TaxID=752182 RepID=UPI0035A27349
MNLAVACVVFFLSTTQLLGEEMDWSEDTYWPDQDLSQTELDEPTYNRYRLIARKPRPDLFYGIMGKRNTESKRSPPKWQKLDSFIGLMGKRSLSSESEERNTEAEFNRRRR